MENKTTLNEEFITEGASKVKETDVKTVIEQSGSIMKKIGSYSTISHLVDDVKVLLAMLTAYWNQEYDKIPWWVISAVVFSMLYLINPFDLIPDFIPVIGVIDDALVIMLCLKLIEEELQGFKDWVSNNPPKQIK